MINKLLTYFRVALYSVLGFSKEGHLGTSGVRRVPGSGSQQKANWIHPFRDPHAVIDVRCVQALFGRIEVVVSPSARVWHLMRCELQREIARYMMLEC